MTEEKPKKGFLRRLFSANEDAPESESAETEEAETAVDPDGTAETGPEADVAVASPEEIDAAEPQPAKPESAAAESAPAETLAPETAAPPEEEAEPSGAPEEEPDEEAETEEKPPKRGLFARLKQQLGKTKTGLVDKVRDVIRLHGAVDEEMLEDVETVLLQSDVGVQTTMKIVDKLRKQAEARKAQTPEELVGVFQQAMIDILGETPAHVPLQDKPPTVVLVIGVNGVGKTTTIGKLAREFRAAGKSVLMVAGDTFRAAAVEQLTIWAERTDSAIVKQEMGADPASVCYEALAGAEAKRADVILIDTAGRLHTKSNLMKELQKIERVIKKVMPEAPHQTLLILDATTGQNAVSQAQLFSEAVDVTGILMTKLDGTAKGGILVAVADLFQIPILKIGIGEGEHDLRDFDPKAFVEALFAR